LDRMRAARSVALSRHKSLMMVPPLSIARP
jgi:hypothetical protein